MFNYFLNSKKNVLNLHPIFITVLVFLFSYLLRSKRPEMLASRQEKANPFKANAVEKPRLGSIRSHPRKVKFNSG